MAANPASTPHLAVDARSHDFGLVESGALVRHAFRLTNEGPGVLKLKAGTTTCSACTIAQLEKSEVPPGESADVVVEYASKDTGTKFRQTATVLTNDPANPRVELTITGQQINKYAIEPPDVTFGNVVATEPATAQVKILNFLAGELRVLGHAFGDTSSAPQFNATFEALPPDQLPQDAKSGIRMVVSLKPGLPLGPFQQKIRLTLEMDPGGEQIEQTVFISGTIVGDLTLVGPGWHPEAGVLVLGSVDADRGTTRKLTLLARGGAQGDVKIEPLQIEPSWLRVTLGPRSTLNEAVEQIPLTIEVPPGQAPGVYLGNDQGRYATIVLGVKDRPDFEEFRMYLKFLIEKKN